jgi:hypothetical protein
VVPPCEDIAAMLAPDEELRRDSSAAHRNNAIECLYAAASNEILRSRVASFFPGDRPETAR